MSTVNVGICQMQSFEDEVKNIQQIKAILNKQNLNELDIICFPENCLYFQIDMSPGKRGFVSLESESIKYFEDLCKKSKTAFHLGGVPIVEGDNVFNSVVWIEPGQKAKVIYKKIHLFDVELKDRSIRESDTFTAGDKPSIIDYLGFSLAQSICYDLRFPHLYEYYAKKNAHIIFVPAAFFAETGKLHWHTLLRARAIESQAYVVAAAQAGIHKNVEGMSRKTYGHSLIIDPNGRVLAEGSASAPDFIKAKLGRFEVEDFKARIPINKARKEISD